MIELRTCNDGVLLAVKAQPGARSSGIRGIQNGALKVCVTQPAEKGKANKALVVTLAKALGLRKSQIELTSGQTASQKRFLVRDILAGQLRERIEEVLDRDLAE